MAVVLNEGYSINDRRKYLAKASGCRVWDLDGRTFVDMALAGGSAILGHANRPIVKASMEQLSNGSLFTSPSLMAHQYCELLESHLAPPIRICIQQALDRKPLYGQFESLEQQPEKKKIAIFSGCWHGSHDLLLVEDDPCSNPRNPGAMLKSAETTKDVLEQVIVLPYNDPVAFELIRKHYDKIAMVFIEPAQGSNPRSDIGDFLLGLRKVCRKQEYYWALTKL